MALTLKLFFFSRNTNSTQSRLPPSERVITQFLGNWAYLALLFNNCCFSEPRMSHTLWLEAACSVAFHKEKQDQVVRDHLPLEVASPCARGAWLGVQWETGSCVSLPLAFLCGHFILGLITHLPFLLRLLLSATLLSDVCSCESLSNFKVSLNTRLLAMTCHLMSPTALSLCVFILQGVL